MTKTCGLLLSSRSATLDPDPTHRPRAVNALQMTSSPSMHPEDVPEHDVRSFLAEVRGDEYVAYGSLEEARADPDSAVILSGDYGGTIFLTVPVRLLRCDLATLRTLVSDMDAVTWMSGDLTIATVAIEKHPVGTGVVGGDGGGAIVDGVWVHPTTVAPELRDQVIDVVQGMRPRVDTALLRQLRDRELARKKEWRTTHPSRIKLAWDFDIGPPAIPFD